MVERKWTQLLTVVTGSYECINVRGDTGPPEADLHRFLRRPHIPVSHPLVKEPQDWHSICDQGKNRQTLRSEVEEFPLPNHKRLGCSVNDKRSCLASCCNLDPLNTALILFRYSYSPLKLDVMWKAVEKQTRSPSLAPTGREGPLGCLERKSEAWFLGTGWHAI